MAIQKKERIASPFGVIPQTYSFPLKLTKGQEERILEISRTARDVWNQMLMEYTYRRNLYKRVQEGTALESEKTPSRNKKNKGEMIWDDNCSVFSLNYLIKDMRKSLPEIGKRDAVLSWGVTRKLVDSFESYYALRKNNDPDARRPQEKRDTCFQTLIYLDKKRSSRGNNAGSIIIEKDFILPVPQSTLDKIGDRRIASLEIKRSESKIYLPGTYTCSIVTYENAPVPGKLSRVVGVDLGSTGVGVIDSRGRSFFIKMRRPDYYWRRKLSPEEIKKGMVSIPFLDAQIETLRQEIKNLPQEEQKPAWQKLERSKKYQRLIQKRQKLFLKMKYQQKDYHKKLVNYLIGFGDIFIVGKSIIRSKEGALANTHNGNKKKNWNVQNTGSLSEVIQLLHWRAKRAGKIVIESPDIKIDEQEYRLRKVRQAQSHLLWGLGSNVLSKSMIKHRSLFEKGFQVLAEHNWNNASIEDRDYLDMLAKHHQSDVLNTEHIQKLICIVKKSHLDYKKVSVPL